MRGLAQDVCRLLLCLLTGLIVVPAVARADAGAVRASQRQGKLRLTVFSNPTPLRVGLADVSLLVQNVETGEQLYPPAEIELSRPGQTSPPVRYHATRDSATNKLFQAAQVNLPQAGLWTAAMTIDGPTGKIQFRFDLDVAEELPQWRSLWLWYCWPFLVVALFALGVR
jgi:hypothetical protein